ncbi:MAG TPA: hypothetical protein PLR99_03070 [Polyangiaceae bacterium]|nr:hypothetical protein [Polyangiaceae bacterium]
MDGTVITVRTTSAYKSTFPVWAAVQDGDAAWVRVPKPGATFAFGVTGARYGVAAACAEGQLQVRYSTPDVTTVDVCNSGGSGASGPSYFLRGQVRNADGAGWLSYTGTRTTGQALPSGGGAVSLELWTGYKDLVFGLRPSQHEPLTRVLVKRGLPLTETLGANPPVTLDFAVEGRAVTLRTLAVTGLSDTDLVGHDVTWSVDGRSPFRLQTSEQGRAMSDTYAAIDPSQLRASDAYILTVSAAKNGTHSLGASYLTGRFTKPIDLTLDMTFPNPVASLAGSAPYGRARLEYPDFPNAYAYALYASSASKRTQWNVSVARSYFSPGEPTQVTIPDLSGVPGWSAAWGFPAGSPIAVEGTLRERSGLSDGSQERTTYSRGYSVTP